MLLYVVVKIIVDLIVGVKMIDLMKVVVYMYKMMFDMLIGKVVYDV